MKAPTQCPTAVAAPMEKPLLMFLFAGLKIAFRGICARPDRSSIGRRVLLASAELDSSIEGLTETSHQR
jgi:hypothetical protein